MIRLTLLLSWLAACLFAGTAAADERILEYRSDILLEPGGQLRVTELIRVQVEGRQIRRGIYRDFPTRYRDRLGNHVVVEFTPLSVKRNGTPEAWHTRDLSNGVRIYAGNANRTVENGAHDYELTFRTNRQLGYFENHDELYFNAIGHGWEFPIDRAVVTVTLPFQPNPGELAYSVYTGRQGSQDGDATVEVTASNKIRFETQRPLQPREGLTIVVSWPKGLVAEPTIEQRFLWFLGDNGAAIALLLGWLGALAWYVRAWLQVGRDPDKGVIIPLFEPPNNLSPAACRYVNDMSFDRNAFTAAIISLAVKRQLSIEEDGKDFTLSRLPGAAAAPLTRGEQAVLDKLLPGRNSSIGMDNENHAQFRGAAQALKKELKREYLGQLFHYNSMYIVPAVLISIAAAIIAIFLDGGPALWITYGLLTLGLHGLFAFLMRAPTRIGRQVMDEIDGFRMYLGTAEQDRLERMRSPQLTPEVFEAFLPYAYALGVENSWCRRFARELPRDQQQSGYHPAWYSGQFHGINALHHLGDSFSSSFSTAIASASTPPGSSSGSGGGGFSGGGGGGGGGGGW
ncbi:MAG: DUF2207 domain-containing protein [Xanthomonadales bacterium]|jgi:uncharacterized membrane protein YgcG|nr:DUF2207 domain-containing protein [Xanthomonadales bacterium]MDH3924475.1 DUF2207 domain-containing protein [Xanthomonadales bacterium]MDH4000053.1 DUF2207 domain-containing protein [Xanthomonadales bacterium]